MSYDFRTDYLATETGASATAFRTPAKVVGLNLVFNLFEVPHHQRVSAPPTNPSKPSSDELIDDARARMAWQRPAVKESAHCWPASASMGSSASWREGPQIDDSLAWPNCHVHCAEGIWTL